MNKTTIIILATVLIALGAGYVVFTSGTKPSAETNRNTTPIETKGTMQDDLSTTTTNSITEATAATEEPATTNTTAAPANEN